MKLITERRCNTEPQNMATACRNTQSDNNAENDYADKFLLQLTITVKQKLPIKRHS